MRRYLAVIIVVIGLSAGTAWADPCQMGRVGALAVTWEDNRPLAPVAINGREVNALIDTGASASSFFRNGADGLGLSYTILGGATARGLGGAARVYTTRVDQVTLAGKTANDVTLRVLDYNWRGRTDIAMILGQNLLASDNLELDFTAGRLTFFRTRGDCDETALAYWSEDWSVIDMLDRGNHGHVRVEVQLNGQPMRALLDTGAPTSVVTREAAARLGVTSESPEVVEAGSSTGIGGRRITAWLGRFDSFTMGGESIANARLKILDTGSLPGNSGINFDMILGADFFRSHRVMLAYSQRKVYFVHTGGRVFQSTGPIGLPDEEDEAGASAPAAGQARPAQQ